jgi:putative ABC transport system ATP-binding protein
LSLGQQQRVGVARALVCEPQVVLLDEPTSALDRPAVERFAQSLRRLCREKGMTFLVVTHDLWFAERAADHAVFLEAGHIRERAQAGRFFEAPQTDALRRFLLGSEGAGGT